MAETKGPRRGRERGREGEAADAFAATCEALAVLLDAGLSPASAWMYAGEQAEHPQLRQLGSAIATAGDPVAVLREAAERSSEAMRTLAAVWMVADRAGASLAPALRGAAWSLRDRAETARDIHASLAGPRATARLMSWLPLVGVLMAVASGIDVVGTLIGSSIGLTLLAVGLSLLLAGRAWTSRLVRRAVDGGPVAGTSHDLLAIALSGGLSVARSRAMVEEALGQSGVSGRDIASVDRTLLLAERAGAPAVELLRSSATSERHSARAAGRAKAAVLGVKLLLPLGLCVLPAFLALGVAPVILALISSTVSGLA